MAQAHVTEEALTLLADAGPPALEHLCLCRSYVTRRAAERLARSPVLDALTALDLRHNRLGDGAVEVLAANPRAARLTHLLLAGNRIGPRGCRALARSPVLHRLTHLDLSRNPLGPLGAEALATAALDGLVHLERPGASLPSRADSFAHPGLPGTGGV